MSSSKASTCSRSKSDTDSESDFEERLKILGKIKSSELKIQLRRDGILFNDKDTKPELQALLALSKLDVLPAGEVAPREAVLEVAGWCSMTVPDLNDLIEAREIKVKGDEVGKSGKIDSI